MRATVDKVWVQIKEYFSGLTPRERRRLIILAALILVLSILAAWLLARTTWVTLEAGLSPAEAGLHMEAIEALGYTARLASGGTAIEVPEKERMEIWTKLNSQGTVGSQTLSPDLYEEYLNTLGATDKDKSYAVAWQYQSWLQQKINELAYIKDSAVIISPGTSSTSLLGAGSPPSASIKVTTQNNATLTETQVQGIVSYAARAWNGLTADNITLIDNQGIMYDTTSGSAELDSTSLTERVALESQIRSTIERQVTNLFTPVVGAGNLRVLVTAEVDMDSTTIDSVEFSPPVDGMEEGLLVSLYRLWESSALGEAAVGIPGTDTNGIGTVEYPYTDLEADEYYRKQIIEGNYELNEINTSIVKAKGSINRLSVGIIVNSDAVDEDYTDIMATLTATALGITAKDVSVSQLPFVPVIDDGGEDVGGVFSNPDIVSLLIKAMVVLLLGLAVIILLGILLKPARREQLALSEGGAVSIDYVADGEIIDLGEDGLLLDSAEDEDEAEPEEIPVPLPLLDSIEVPKDVTVLQLEDFIDRDPAAAVQLLRNWITEE